MPLSVVRVRRALSADVLERVWIASVIAYGIPRLLVAWGTFGDQGANVWVFAAIDFGTAWPYAKSVALICRRCAAGAWRALAAPGVVAAVSFLAPYVYLWVAAPTASMELRGGLIIFVIVMACAAGIGLVRRVASLKKQAVIDLREPQEGDGSGSPATSERLVIGRFDDPRLLPARLMQARIYAERGLLHESHNFDEAGAIVDAWSSQAIHFAIYDGERPVAHARLVAPHPLPTPLQHYCDVDLDAPGLWEWSAHAVVKRDASRSRFAIERHIASFMAHNEIYQFLMLASPALVRRFEGVSGIRAVRVGPDEEGYNEGPMLFDIGQVDSERGAYFLGSSEARIDAATVLPGLAKLSEVRP